METDGFRNGLAGSVATPGRWGQVAENAGVGAAACEDLRSNSAKRSQFVLIPFCRNAETLGQNMPQWQIDAGGKMAFGQRFECFYEGPRWPTGTIERS